MVKAAIEQNTIRREDLERYGSSNIGQLLILVSKDFQKRALAKFVERGHAGLQPAHISVIENLGLSGTRLTKLARRARMTKQGMGQLVDEMERLGYVERVPDPEDNRAKIARFTDKGFSLMADGVSIVESIKKEYANLIGKERVELLRATLDDLHRNLKSPVA